MSNSKSHSWPALPYKGLSYYGPEDQAIFAGRDANILPCARLLGASDTRVLILHGLTGCGKSSFLLAGLIPFLESPERGFQFLKDGGPQAKAIFVRSTGSPLVKLTEEIHKFALSRPEIQTPEGPIQLNLSSALLGFEGLDSFRDNVLSKPNLMLKSLSELASLVPHTLVLVVDQAEEVLTLNSGVKGQALRDQFFDFLAAFSRLKIDLKLVIAIRSEFYGRFRSQIQHREWDPRRICEFMLEDLNELQSIQAINRPTSDLPVDHFGIPYKQYKFRYASGLPEKIAKDLELAMPQGGKLPILQLVCARLYRTKREEVGQGTPFEISEATYNELGGVKGQLVAHLKDVLTELAKLAELSEPETRPEIVAWVRVFRSLWREQPDGTVVKELVADRDLQKEAVRVGCRVNFDAAMDFLQGGDRRVIAPVDVLNVQTKQTVHCYTLGHDAIGLALKSWPTEEAERVKEEAERQKQEADRLLLLEKARAQLKMKQLGGASSVFYGLLFLLPHFLGSRFGGTTFVVLGLLFVVNGLVFLFVPGIVEKLELTGGFVTKKT